VTYSDVRLWASVGALCVLAGAASFWLGWTGASWMFR
jgi:hypothetical protein